MAVTISLVTLEPRAKARLSGFFVLGGKTLVLGVGIIILDALGTHSVSLDQRREACQLP